MHKCGYIGRSPYMIEVMLQKDNIDLTNVLFEGNMPQSLLDKLAEKQIPVVFFTNKAELVAAIKEADATDYFMYLCGIIIPEEITNNYSIINIHPGSLENNKGATPVIRAILRGDKYTVVNAYRITEEIDTGKIIARKIITVVNDDSVSLTRKIEAAIPEIIDRVLDDCDSKSKRDSFYCRRVSESEFTIDLKRDSIEDVEKKVRSQAIYYGAIYGDSRIVDMNVDSYDWNVVSEDDDKVICEVVSKVVLKKKDTNAKRDSWHSGTAGGWR